ncbi:MAG: fimbrillin family protein, partial [Prevotella sp.]|nr:fimbrillin family protein [Prevotella sp.]
MKKASFIASVCMAVLCCMSCGGSDDPVSPVTPPVTPDKPSAKVPISISTNITRATETAFESGDKVGLFVVNRNTDGSAASLNTSGNYVDNMLYTYTNVWTPATEIYWKDEKTHADFYLYYPYRQQVESVTAMPFSTKANQSTEADYKAGDLLIGSTLDAAPSSEAVRIEAKHIMSQVDIRLKPGAGFTESTLAAANVKVSLNNIKTSATVDLATATATATGQASAITPYNDGSAYHAIIVPQ